jgi:hypothetical protein
MVKSGVFISHFVAFKIHQVKLNLTYKMLHIISVQNMSKY